MPTAKSVVSQFITQVRSGIAPESAHLYMAEEVTAHQVISGEEHIIMRTPADYTEHVHEFLTCYGQFDFTVQEMLCDDDKVYVRWQQIGQHLTEIMGFQPTGKTLSTVGSAVYRVVDDKIVEYWIQQENQGLFAQLRANASRID